MEYARDDLKTAARLLAPPPLCNQVCFHAQQAVEKALKAVLASAGVPISRTHDLSALFAAAAQAAGWKASTSQGWNLADLASLAVHSRYPTSASVEVVEETVANNMMTMAEEILDYIEHTLNLLRTEVTGKDQGT